MQILTDREIREDIAAFQDRTTAAKEKLSNLPGGYLDFKKHKKREKQRRQLEDDIRHLKKLQGYAVEALNEYCEN